MSLFILLFICLEVLQVDNGTYWYILVLYLGGGHTYQLNHLRSPSPLLRMEMLINKIDFPWFFNVFLTTAYAFQVEYLTTLWAWFCCSGLWDIRVVLVSFLINETSAEKKHKEGRKSNAGKAWQSSWCWDYIADGYLHLGESENLR